MKIGPQPKRLIRYWTNICFGCLSPGNGTMYGHKIKGQERWYCPDCNPTVEKHGHHMTPRQQCDARRKRRIREAERKDRENRGLHEPGK